MASYGCESVKHHRGGLASWCTVLKIPLWAVILLLKFKLSSQSDLLNSFKVDFLCLIMKFKKKHRVYKEKMNNIKFFNQILVSLL